MSDEAEQARGELLVGTIELFHSGGESTGEVPIHGTETEVAAAILEAFDEDESFEGVVIAVRRSSADAPPNPNDPRVSE